MEELETKIRQLSLTQTDRTIAEYILDNLDTIGLQTSTTLAQNMGVSDTSVIRFIQIGRASCRERVCQYV